MLVVAKRCKPLLLRMPWPKRHIKLSHPVSTNVDVEVASRYDYVGLWNSFVEVAEFVLERVKPGLSWCVDRNQVGSNGGVDGEDCQAVWYWWECHHALDRSAIHHKPNASLSFLSTRVINSHCIVVGWRYYYFLLKTLFPHHKNILHSCKADKVVLCSLKYSLKEVVVCRM